MVLNYDVLTRPNQLLVDGLVQEIASNLGKPLIECVNKEHCPRQQNAAGQRLAEAELDPRNWGLGNLKLLLQMSAMSRNPSNFYDRLVTEVRQRLRREGDKTKEFWLTKSDIESAMKKLARYRGLDYVAAKGRRGNVHVGSSASENLTTASTFETRASSKDGFLQPDGRRRRTATARPAGYLGPGMEQYDSYFSQNARKRWPEDTASQPPSKLARSNAHAPRADSAPIGGLARSDPIPVLVSKENGSPPKSQFMKNTSALVTTKQTAQSPDVSHIPEVKMLNVPKSPETASSSSLESKASLTDVYLTTSTTKPQSLNRLKSDLEAAKARVNRLLVQQKIKERDKESTLEFDLKVTEAIESVKLLERAKVIFIEDQKELAQIKEEDTLMKEELKLGIKQESMVQEQDHQDLEGREIYTRPGATRDTAVELD
ncbi:uncharacterized protein BDZ99DRAFT_525367 [Mytilinidion resinicola]|uniref:Uncharacterized protein n=1 Tax=Mytilinidion resinicola TaxID=574789 RepID=A0A6A6Y6U9_9PEZI|nr:uncharacterized protein BDZ99DRAFT_525367 [Mytilinidion resinicola]KAF2804532.1 hypothetical protein BDZ99DRAFT_525367 [Mytilinidion resinicola]